MRNHRLDWIRAIAIIFVLVIHSVHQYVNTDNQEIIAGWFSTVTRPTIAMFLFSSGYFFRVNPTFPYLVDRYKRVLAPYLVFSFLAILYQQRIIRAAGYIIANWDSVLTDLLFGNTWGIYWFIPLIIFIYTLGFLLLRSRLGQHLPFLVLIFLVTNLMHGVYYQPLIEHYCIENTRIIWYYSYRFFISWPFFFFLGMATHQYQELLVADRYKKLILIIWIFAFLMVNLLYFTDIGLTDMYNSIIGTIYSLATISLIFLINVENKVVTFISKLSYLIYLAHYFFVCFLKAITTTILGIECPFWFWLVSFTFSLAGPIILYVFAKKVFREKSLLWIGA